MNRLRFYKHLLNRPKATLVLVGTVILLVFLLNWGKEATLNHLRADARKKDNIVGIANLIAVFNHPVPGGFSWRSATELPLSKSVTVEDHKKFMVSKASASTVGSRQAQSCMSDNLCHFL
jgi:hypothetical protein